MAKAVAMEGGVKKWAVLVASNGSGLSSGLLGIWLSEVQQLFHLKKFSV